jgi:glutathione synthase/RimK-type ligase-like ATP-grasp enzyme
LFNSHRFTKHNLYELLIKDDTLSQHIPPTELSKDHKQIKTFIKTHKKVILKPIDLSRGICIIEKNDDGYKIYDHRTKSSNKMTVNREEMFDKFFELNPCFFKRYLIQKHLNLAKIDGCIFDIRVVMQKNCDLLWKCTGIECRVGNPEILITNISKGGHALLLNEALEKVFPDHTDFDCKIKQINDLCKDICLHLDTTNKHFAEFGIDIAFDEDKNLWIIEVNVFPSFQEFKDIDYSNYLSIRHTPLLYALSLTDFANKKMIVKIQLLPIIDKIYTNLQVD